MSKRHFKSSFIRTYPFACLAFTLATSGLLPQTHAQTVPIDPFRNTVATPTIAAPSQSLKTLNAEIVDGNASGGAQEGTGMALRYTDSLPSRVNSIEYRRQSRFNNEGQQIAAQQTRPLNDRQRITFGGNAGETSLFPQLGLSGVFEHDWGISRVGATRVGLSHQRLHNSVTQNSLLLEQAGRLPMGAVWQLGRIQGVSNPGDRSFHTNYVVVQYQSSQHWRALLRRQWSSEAFQQISNAGGRSDFNSQNLRIALGYEWRPRNWVSVYHDRYDNPFYERRQLGLMLEHAW